MQLIEVKTTKDVKDFHQVPVGNWYNSASDCTPMSKPLFVAWFLKEFTEICNLSVLVKPRWNFPTNT